MIWAIIIEIISAALIALLKEQENQKGKHDDDD